MDSPDRLFLCVIGLFALIAILVVLPDIILALQGCPFTPAPKGK